MGTEVAATVLEKETTANFTTAQEFLLFNHDCHYRQAWERTREPQSDHQKHPFVTSYYVCHKRYNDKNPSIFLEPEYDFCMYPVSNTQ